MRIGVRGVVGVLLLGMFLFAGMVSAQGRSRNLDTGIKLTAFLREAAIRMGGSSTLPRSPAPKNSLGLTKEETARGKDFADSCVKLAKKMAGNKQTDDNLDKEEKKLYKLCTELFSAFFTDYLARQRSLITQVTTGHSNDAVVAGLLLITPRRVEDPAALEVIFEVGIENQVVSLIGAVEAALIDLLEESDRAGYSIGTTVSNVFLP